MLHDQKAPDAYSTFVRRVEPGLRRALTAGFGIDVGREAAAEALAYGWQNWDRVQSMSNPSGYLFRVGQSAARRLVKPPRSQVHASEAVYDEPWVEPRFGPAWSTLSERQRTVAGLVHGYGWSLSEVADLLGVSKSAIQIHERRAMQKLRRELGVQQ